MFNKLIDYLMKNSLDLRTVKYTTGTIAILYILSNFPRPPSTGNMYYMRKY